jgi:hypothetical protein
MAPLSIAQRTDERDRDYEVREGQPVGAVGEERIRVTRRDETVADAVDLLDETGRSRRRRRPVGVQQIGPEPQLGLQREAVTPRDHEPDHDDDEPESDPPEGTHARSVARRRR